MMKRKRIAAFLLAAVLLLSLAVPVRAAQESTDALVRKLINYFHYYQEDAQLDYELLLEQIAAQDPALARTWEDILRLWLELNGDMALPNGVLPDGLPEDDSLCIVVMGYQLNSDGTMREELYSRLKVTLASAQKYPNAYILCTGGGTASKKETVTEAGQMAKWLKNKGIDPERILVEKDAMSTIQNAIYGCKLLYRDYPQVKNLAVITSDYHSLRSCLYFHTQAALEAYEMGNEPMKVIAGATCRINPTSSKDVARQVEGVGMLSELDGVEELSRPALTKLTQIRISGAMEYAPNGQPNFTVTAYYSSGYSRNVTEKAELSGYDLSRTGFQTVRAVYTEGTACMEAEFDIYVIPPDGESPAETQPETMRPEVPEKAPETQEKTIWPIMAAGTALLLLAVLCLRAGRRRKRRRRRRPVIRLD